jgi:hypothetical protein
VIDNRADALVTPPPGGMQMKAVLIALLGGDIGRGAALAAMAAPR